MTIALPTPAPGEVWETPHGVKLRPPHGATRYYRLDYVLGGRRRQPSVGRDVEQAWAQAMRADRLLAAEAGDLGMLPVAALVTEWVRVCSPRWSPRYRMQVADVTARFILPLVGDLPCVDLRKSHIREVIAAGSTPSVRRVTRTIMSSMVGWGRGEDWLDGTRDLIPPREQACHSGVRFVPLDETPEGSDVARLVAALPAPLGTMVLVAAYCGLRQGEVFALTGGQIRGGILRVDRQVQDITGVGLTIVPPKRGRVRDVVIPTEVAGVRLADLLTARAAEVGTDGLLFPASRGGLWRKGTFSKAWTPTRADAGFTWRFHALRHYYCRWLLAAGVEPKDVSLMAGHASVSTTLDLYVGHTATALGRVRSAVG